MFAKLVRVLKRALLVCHDIAYLNGLIEKNGALHEIIGSSDRVCSFCSKQLTALVNVKACAAGARLLCSALSGVHAVSSAEHDMFLVLNGMGFKFYEGDEVCDIEDNFYSLNFPKLHPSLDSEDSFYIRSERSAELLRTHTTSSVLRAIGGVRNELRGFTIGKVYRNDSGPKHLPVFTQVEGVICERGLRLINVISLVKLIICKFLKTTPHFRLRRAQFPFTEPSLEIDLCRGRHFSSFKCDYG